MNSRTRPDEVSVKLSSHVGNPGAVVRLEARAPEVRRSRMRTGRRVETCKVVRRAAHAPERAAARARGRGARELSSAGKLRLKLEETEVRAVMLVAITARTPGMLWICQAETASHSAFVELVAEKGRS